MKVRTGRKILGLVASTLLATTGLVFYAERVVQAASFVNPPERLYMVPSDVPLADLQAFANNAVIPALAGIPIGTLEFGGTGTDPISGDPYKITVDTVNGDAGCDLTQPPYDDDDCSRLQLSGVQSGRISMGAITTVDDGEGPGLDVYLLPSGARIDNPYQVAAGSYSLGINGTPAQLQAALDDLVYTPDDDYYYTAGATDPEVLNIVIVPGNSDDPDPTPEPDTTDSIDIDIRVLRINGFPTHDGPDNRTAQPDVELKLPAVDPPQSRPYPTALFTVADADNDESIDADTNEPGELPDGANSAMMLIGWLDCGASAVLDDSQHGFHFRGGTFQSDDVQLQDFFELLYNVSANPDYQLVIDGLIAALDSIDPGLKDIVLATSNPSLYTTAFAGVADMATVEYALSQVSFRHHDPGATCELITVVLDLGNNGLPLQYVGSPPTGIEIPFIGFDWNVLTLNVGQPEVIDISFDPEPIYVLEGNPTEARMLISPTPHPAFEIGWEANPKNGEAVVPGQAEADVDFAGTYNNSPLIPEDATIVSASTNLTLSLPDEMVFADNTVEGTETFVYRILPDAYDPPLGYAITSAVPTRTVYILDDDDPDRKVLSFVGSTTLEGDPGDDKSLTFTITLDDLADGDESLDVSLGVGTADGDDYAPFAGASIDFDPGQASATITIPIQEDLTDEADETVVLTLGNFVNMDGTGPMQATGTIQNDDAPRQVVAVAAPDINEGNVSTMPMMFTITLSGPAKAGDQVTVNTSGAQGNDYADLVDVVVPLTVGQLTTQVQVDITSDTSIEPDELVTLTLSSPSPGVLLTIDSGTGTIVNDDGLPAASINNAQIVEGNAGNSNMNFTVSLSAPAIQASSVMVTSTDVSATAGSDFGVVSQLVNFAIGEDSKQVSVSIAGDVTGEFDETFTLNLSTPAGVTIADGSGTGTITNDDLDVTFVAQGPTAEGAPASIVIGIFPPIHPEVTVGVATVDGSATAATDFSLVGSTVTIPADMPSGSSPATVFTNPDFDFEPNETFTVIVTPGASPPGFTVRWDNVPASYTIVDDDPQSVVSIADAVAVEGGGSADVPVSMTNVLPTRVCNVTLTTTTGTASASDFTPFSDIPLAVDGASTLLAVGITNDTEVEVAEQFTVGMVLLPGQPNCVLGDSSSTVTIVDNDDLAPTLSIADASITEGTGAGTTTISFALSTSGLQPVDCGFRAVVTHVTTTDADFVSTALFDVTAVFDTNDVALNRTFDIARDVSDEPDETFTLTITGNGATPCPIADGVATGTIIDDDLPLQPLSIADASVVEGTGGAPTQISLNVTATGLQPADCGFRVVATHVTTSDADFESTALFDVTAVFDTNDVTLPRTFDIVQDAIDELNETFTVTITGNGANPCPIAGGVATGTIIDDDGLPPDTTNPSVSVEQAPPPQADPTSGSPVNFTVTFFEPVNGFDAADLSFAGSTAPGTLAGVITGSGPSYDVAVDGMTGSGLVVLSIPGGVVTDLAGNPNSASTSEDNTVQYDAPDLTKPTVLINQAEGQADPTSSAPIVFSVLFSELVVGFEAGDVTLGGTAGATSVSVAATANPLNFLVSVSGMSASGTVIASIAAGVVADGSGNTNTASTSTDNTVTYLVLPGPLTLNLPGGVSKNNDPGQAGAIVTYPTVTASGGVPPIVVSCDKPSGAFFPIGATTVSCTATDSEGSLGEAIVSGSFTVTVTDTESPVISDNADIVRATTGTSGIAVTFSLPTATDNSGAAPAVTCNRVSGSVFPIGTTTVTCTATDAAGNSASSSFTVTVTSSGGLPPTGGSPLATTLLAAALLALGLGLTRRARGAG